MLFKYRYCWLKEDITEHQCTFATPGLYKKVQLHKRFFASTDDEISPNLSVSVVMLCFNFILGSVFIFLCFIHYHTPPFTKTKENVETNENIVPQQLQVQLFSAC